MRYPAVALLLASLLPAVTLAQGPETVECPADNPWDYVVVGSGPAGCVFARRAAECGYRVLLLERGDYNPEGEFDVGDYLENRFNSADNRIPKMFTSAVPDFPGTDFKAGAGSANLDFTQTLIIEGKMRGGGAAINAMKWSRLDLEDVTPRNGWPRGWDPEWLQKGMMMTENIVNVERNDHPTVLSDSFLGAAQSQGYSFVDANLGGPEENAIYMTPIARKDGKRHDAFTAYINEADDSIKNLITVLAGPQYTVTEIAFEDDFLASGTGESRKRARAVETAFAGRFCGNLGVVLAAGAVGSPIILQSSGILPAGDLLAQQARAVNSQLGKNLQDHLQLFRTFVLPVPWAILQLLNPTLPDYDFFAQPLSLQAVEYLNNQDGLFADSFAKLSLFSKENGSSKHNFEAHLVEGLPFFPEAQVDPTIVGPTGGQLTIGFALLSLDIESKGEVNVVNDPPIISANWGDSDDQIEAMISGLQRLRRLLAATQLPWVEVSQDGTAFPLFLPRDGDPDNTDPSNLVFNDHRHSLDEFKELLKTPNEAAGNIASFSSFHFTGSLSLGKVVNPHTLQVCGNYVVIKPPGSFPPFAVEEHDILGLHVVDASIIPKIPRRNTMGPIYAVAEIASAKILKKDLQAKGDPHFKTWAEQWYDFHGECDLVLLSSPQFADGLGLDIHIRTKSRGDYSFIETVAVKIGAQDVLEVTGYGGYLLNGVESGALPGKLASFTVTHENNNKKLHTFKIELGNDRDIEIRSFKDLVSVKVENAIAKDFSSSKGLMGDYRTGELLARNGTVIASNPNAFGQEWQVRDSADGMLFSTERAPQYPTQCKMPSSTTTTSEGRRRLGSSTIAEEAAETACARWGAQKDKCVYDVMATGDLEVADAGAF